MFINPNPSSSLWDSWETEVYLSAYEGSRTADPLKDNRFAFMGSLQLVNPFESEYKTRIESIKLIIPPNPTIKYEGATYTQSNTGPQTYLYAMPNEFPDRIRLNYDDFYEIKTVLAYKGDSALPIKLYIPPEINQVNAEITIGFCKTEGDFCSEKSFDFNLTRKEDWSFTGKKRPVISGPQEIKPALPPPPEKNLSY
jgi:hypothetical protein